MHVLRQVALQVDRIKVFDDEVHFDMKIPLQTTHAQEGGPMRSRTKTSFVGRISAAIGRLVGSC